MFSQVISNAASLANQIMGLPMPTEAQPVAQHVINFSAAEIPALQALAASTASFASNGGATVTAMLTALAGGASPASLEPQLKGLQTAIATLSTQTTSENSSLSTTRDTFNADVGSLQTLQVNLAAQAAGLAAQQSNLAEKAASIQSEIDAMNVIVWIPLIGPIIKGASERASVNYQIAVLNGMLAQTDQLQSLIGQLATGTQNLVNTVTMVQGTLDNEDAFLKGAGDMPKLFLIAAQSSIAQLATLVS